MRTHLKDIVTDAVGRGVDRFGGATRDRGPFDPSPQLVHSVQFGGSRRQKPYLDGQVLGHLQGVLGGVRRPPVLKADNRPASPMGPDHAQEVLMRLLHPFVRDQQKDLATPDIEGAVQDPLRPIPGDGDTDLLPDPPIAGVEWGCFRHDRFIQHHNHRTTACRQARAKPPLACRHVGDRRAK